VEVTTLEDHSLFYVQGMKSEIVSVMTCYHLHPLWAIHRQLPIFVCRADPELDHVEIGLGHRPTAVRDA
jgi:hypothetical protein